MPSRAGNTGSILAWRAIVLASYPLLILVALWLGEPRLRALALPVLGLALVGPPPFSRIDTLILSTALALALASVLFPTIALWPPAFACLGVAVLFGASLVPGRTPLIEDLARQMHALIDTPLPDNSQGWLRFWTGVWTVLMTVLGVVALGLAFEDRASMWLVWMSMVAPLAMISTMLLEFLLRRWRFPGAEHIPAGRFLVLLVHVRPGRPVP